MDIDGVVSVHTNLLSDGDGNLASDYDSGDGIHPNNNGRKVIAWSWLQGYRGAAI